MKNRDEIEIFGYNSRLDTIQAVVGNCLIDQAPGITSKRIENAQRYDKAFQACNDTIRLPFRRPDVKRVYHLYIFETDCRDELHTYLLEKKISSKIHYPIPLFLQKGLAHLGYKQGDFPETERQGRSILTLPVDQHLTREQQQTVIDTVKAFFDR